MSQPALKPSYDVVIAGGGAVGSAAAYFLAASPDFSGSILVVERDWTYSRAATALSSASIRHQFSNPLNVRISQFGTDFIRHFADHCAVGSEQPDLAFRENGYLFLAADDRGRRVLEANHGVQSGEGADIRLLSAMEMANRFPWLRTDDLTLGSLGESGEGWFDNMGLLYGLRAKARALDATYIENEVVGLRRSGQRVSHVSLADGSEVACGTFINTAGTRAPTLAAMAGLDLPVEPRRRSLFVVDCRNPPEGRIPMTIDPSGVFFRPEGRFFLCGCAPEFDPRANLDDFAVAHDEFEEIIWPVLAERVPAFEALKVVNSWAGHYDFCTFDQNVIVGPHPEVDNFLFASGFSGHGLQQSPAIGRGLSELVIYGGYRSLDLGPLGCERVFAGTRFPENSVI